MLCARMVHILCSLILSVVNLICWVPTLLQLLFRNRQIFHRKVSSDIPGNPMQFDDLIICLFRTLPEPSNFNIVWTGIMYGLTFRVFGELPNSRMNSLSLYCREKSEPPVTIDFSSIPVSKHRCFDVMLFPDNVTLDEGSPMANGSVPSVRVTYPSSWKGGYIAMRNYLVPPGTRVVTPRVQSCDGVTIDRLPEVLYAGNTGIKNHDLTKLRRVVLLNGLAIVFMTVALHFPLESSLVTVFGGLLGLRLLYGFLFALGKKGIRKHFDTVCTRPNELVFPDSAAASKVSQPSREHRYWVMRYDLSAVDKDLMISSRIRPSGQQYWSLVVYDEYGLPLPQYLNDVNVQFADKKRLGEEYELRIRLSNRVPSYQYQYTCDADVLDETVMAKRIGYGCVDVTGHPKGYVLFRLVHPTDDSVSKYSAPAATIVDPICGNNDGADTIAGSWKDKKRN